MFSLLLAIIYLAFISLGLPDSLLGSAWPVMYEQFGVPLSYAGIVTMIISGGTIVSSLLSDRLTRKFGAGLVTAVSVLMTALALFGFSASRSYIFLCIWSIPYGLGAGAVDAALNNYVALHYASRHMSWLHCFWGVGAAISPYIMSFSLARNLNWPLGFKIVAIIQIVFTAVLFITLPLWKRQAKINGQSTVEARHLTIMQAVKIRGVKYILIAFFATVALETTAGLWASSYLVEYRGIDVDTAASFASLFYLGMTFGRFICGFIADKVGDRRLIRYGIIIIMFGILSVLLPLKISGFALAGLLIIGLGCAPIYPSIIHSTPFNFGRENSQAIVGIQMASAYVGSTFMPPVFGLIAQYFNIALYPVFLLFLAVVMLTMSETLTKVISMAK